MLLAGTRVGVAPVIEIERVGRFEAGRETAAVAEAFARTVRET